MGVILQHWQPYCVPYTGTRHRGKYEAGYRWESCNRAGSQHQHGAKREVAYFDSTVDAIAHLQVVATTMLS
jgi:hypothetical protein